MTWFQRHFLTNFKIEYSLIDKTVIRLTKLALRYLLISQNQNGVSKYSANLTLTSIEIWITTDLGPNKRKSRVCSSNVHSFRMQIHWKYQCVWIKNKLKGAHPGIPASRHVSFDTRRRLTTVMRITFVAAFNTWFTKEMLALFLPRVLSYMAIPVSYSVRHRAGVCVTKFKNNPHETRSNLFCCLRDCFTTLFVRQTV